MYASLACITHDSIYISKRLPISSTAMLCSTTILVVRGAGTASESERKREKSKGDVHSRLRKKKRLARFLHPRIVMYVRTYICMYLCVYKSTRAEALSAVSVSIQYYYVFPLTSGGIFMHIGAFFRSLSFFLIFPTAWPSNQPLVLRTYVHSPYIHNNNITLDVST